MIYYFVFGGIALIFALYFTPFGGLVRLKGIKALNDEERNNIRLKALGANLTVVLIILSAIFILAGAVPFFRQCMFKWFAIGWFVLAVADAVFIGKSGYYVKNKNTGGKR